MTCGSSGKLGSTFPASSSAVLLREGGGRVLISPGAQAHCASSMRAAPSPGDGTKGHFLPSYRTTSQGRYCSNTQEIKDVFLLEGWEEKGYKVLSHPSLWELCFGSCRKPLCSCWPRTELPGRDRRCSRQQCHGQGCQQVPCSVRWTLESSRETR